MSYLCEIGYDRKEMERALSLRTIKILELLIKIYLIPEHDLSYQWKREVANQLHCINRIGHSKKFPSAKKIYSWTYGKKQDLITDEKYFYVLVKDVCNEYNLEPIENTNDFMYDFDDICVSYFKWLAKELNDIGLLSRSEIVTKIDELIC